MEPFSLLDDGKLHTVHLGETFKKNSNSAFHTVRLDFKPASVDVNQPGRVEVTDKHQVEIVLPHQPDSKNPNTVYRGSTKAVQKECLLIIDPQTGSLTLERISSQIQAKKIRIADQKSMKSSKPSSTNPSQSSSSVLKKPIPNIQKAPSKSQAMNFVPKKPSEPIHMPNSKSSFDKYVNSNSLNVVEEEGEVQPDDTLFSTIQMEGAKGSDDESASSSSSDGNSSTSDDSDDDDTNSPPSLISSQPQPPAPTGDVYDDLQLTTSDEDSD